MQRHVNQAEHNTKFHTSICSNHADAFFDWKITCLFYIAIHCIKALAAKKNINIGGSHIDIEKNISPDRPSPIMPIKRRVWDQYKMLYRYSRTARYDGFADEATFEKLMEADHSHSEQLLKGVKDYVRGNGVPVP